MGVAGDLYLAAQEAVRAMIDHLVTGYALTPEDAYLLCSIAVGLKISEIVDGGQYIVSALLPEAVFVAAGNGGDRVARPPERVAVGAAG
jgi:acetamidase/formamidase